MRNKTKHKEPVHTGHACAVPGCKEPGDYKAPKSRYDTDQYQYLCIDHVREFNKAWDYFDGWGRDDIESFRHAANHGHRPTWRMGMGPTFTDEKLSDSFYKMLGEEPPKHHKQEPRLPRKEREALAIMDLDPGASLQVIKVQYKKLVKKYHPDVNKGDKQSEETFKLITAAYTFLTKTYEKHDET